MYDLLWWVGLGLLAVGMFIGSLVFDLGPYLIKRFKKRTKDEKEILKIQMLIKIDNDEPDEVIGLAPFRDKIIIATRVRLLMLSSDKETEIKIQ
ncbi:hypothetical protein LCGC14_3003280, partial [marine sediment metagenome]